MKRTDLPSLLFLKKILINHFPSIKDVIIQDTEDYGFDCTIIDINDNSFPVEVKTSIHHQLYINNQPNPFFQIPGNGLFRTSTSHFEQSHFAYCLNASSKIGNKHIPNHPTCKWEKIKSTPNSMLIFIGADGMITWNHTQLLNSFIDFTTIICKHTTAFNDCTKGEEYKALISFDGGNYYRFNQEEQSTIIDIFLDNLHK